MFKKTLIHISLCVFLTTTSFSNPLTKFASINPAEVWANPTINYTSLNPFVQDNLLIFKSERINRCQNDFSLKELSIYLY